MAKMAGEDKWREKFEREKRGGAISTENSY